MSREAKVYMFARYLGLASQMYVQSGPPSSMSSNTHALRCDRFNVAFTVRMSFGVATSPAGCRRWFIYEAVVVQVLLLIVECLLMTRSTLSIHCFCFQGFAHQPRVYAIYLRQPLILVVLILFGITQLCSMGVSAGLSFPSNKYTITCMMVKSNPGNAFFR